MFKPKSVAQLLCSRSDGLGDELLLKTEHVSVLVLDE